FEDGSGPAVSHQDGTAPTGALDVLEADIDPVDVGAELGEAVQVSFPAPPVIGLQPVVDQFSQVVDIGPVLPAGPFGRIGEGGGAEAGANLLQTLLRHGDGEGSDLAHQMEDDSNPRWRERSSLSPVLSS